MSEETNTITEETPEVTEEAKKTAETELAQKELLTNEELMKQLIRHQKKQLAGDRIRTVVVILFLAILAGIGYFIFREYQNIDQTIQSIQRTVDAIMMDEINNAVTSLSGAADQLRKIDVESLNDTVSALEKAADNLANMDMSELNNLVASLNTVAESLENTVNGMKNFFSFGR